MTSQIEQVNTLKGILVKLGLAEPFSRGFVAFAAAAGVSYLAAYPKAAFNDKGEMRPFKPLSPDPTATYSHFLILPLGVGAVIYLCT